MKILNFIFTCFHSIGKARAASHLARHGRHEEAKALMLSK
jgi:hypothetical protein